MKQRVKLGLALLSGCPVILLDEPISNLDAAGVNWYKKIIAEINTPENIIVVCSNDTAQEAYFCEKEISIEDYLPQPRKI